ncbi:helix-turn-helix domain-containing protein [Microtetraspora malaysiensis]|uniref:Helix-turn-helix domain-containing protein n=1 Tax=Microtetraspora malaysiensis TaxID=161358 RepID=A0ABW6SHQ7_9ACTN
MFSDRSWNACDERPYVHVNTVRFRIRRIEELSGSLLDGGPGGSVTSRCGRMARWGDRWARSG